MRVSDLTLGYSLPKQVLNGLGVSRFRIFGPVQNIFAAVLCYFSKLFIEFPTDFDKFIGIS